MGLRFVFAIICAVFCSETVCASGEARGVFARLIEAPSLTVTRTIPRLLPETARQLDELTLSEFRNKKLLRTETTCTEENTQVFLFSTERLAVIHLPNNPFTRDNKLMLEKLSIANQGLGRVVSDSVLVKAYDLYKGQMSANKKPLKCFIQEGLLKLSTKILVLTPRLDYDADEALRNFLIEIDMPRIVSFATLPAVTRELESYKHILWYAAYTNVKPVSSDYSAHSTSDTPGTVPIMVKDLASFMRTGTIAASLPRTHKENDQIFSFVEPSSNHQVCRALRIKNGWQYIKSRPDGTAAIDTWPVVKSKV